MDEWMNGYGSCWNNVVHEIQVASGCVFMGCLAGSGVYRLGSVVRFLRHDIAVELRVVRKSWVNV